MEGPDGRRFNNRRPVLAALGFAALALWTWGCRNTQPAAVPPAAVTGVSDAGNPGTSPANPSSANQASPPDGLSKNPFDGDKAYELLTRQCEFGPRPLGSPAHEKLRAFLLAQMKLYADNAFPQEFTYRGMPVTNVIGVFNPAGSAGPARHPVLLMAHWDTRPISDGPFSAQTQAGIAFHYGVEGWKPTAPIMGADDGASGVAVLLEIARLLKQKRPPVGVILLLDDGEDYGDFLAHPERIETEQGEGVELGSRYFAKHYHENSVFGQPRFGILLDMVGATDAFFPREEQSDRAARQVNDKVFGVAQGLGYGDIFKNSEHESVNDDHIAIIAAGIDMIDLIHPLPYPPYDTIGYRYWHTQEDTADKCSPKALKTVGDVVTKVIYRETPEPAR